MASRMAARLNGRWTKALVAGAQGAVLALIVLVLISVIGVGFVARWAGVSPGLFTLGVVAVSVLGALAAGAFSFWRAYHREDQPTRSKDR